MNNSIGSLAFDSNPAEKYKLKDPFSSIHACVLVCSGTNQNAMNWSVAFAFCHFQHSSHKNVERYRYLKPCPCLNTHNYSHLLLSLHEPEARAVANAGLFAEDSICTPRGRDGQRPLTAAHTAVMQAHTSGPTEKEYGISCMFSMITPSWKKGWLLASILFSKIWYVWGDYNSYVWASTYNPSITIDFRLFACFFSDLGHFHAP